MSVEGREWAWTLEQVSPTQRLVAMALGDRCYKDRDTVATSLTVLAKRTGMTRKMVVSAVDALEASGHITIDRAATGGGYKTNTYRLFLAGQVMPLTVVDNAPADDGQWFPRDTTSSSPETPPSSSPETPPVVPQRHHITNKTNREPTTTTAPRAKPPDPMVVVVVDQLAKLYGTAEALRVNARHHGGYVATTADRVKREQRAILEQMATDGTDPIAAMAYLDVDQYWALSAADYLAQTMAVAR